MHAHAHTHVQILLPCGSRVLFTNLRHLPQKGTTETSGVLSCPLLEDVHVWKIKTEMTGKGKAPTPFFI